MELKKIKTTYCEIKEAQCLIEGKALDIANIVIGDGNGEIPNLSKDMTALFNQKLKLAVEVDNSKLPKYKFTAVLPNDVEEFQMREIGLVDKDGKLLYVSQMDGSSTNLLNSGISKQIRIQIQFTPAEGINIIVIDPATSTASVDYVNDKINEKIGDIDFTVFEGKSNKGQANGYCPLDKDELVPKKHLPEINNTFIKSYHNVVYGVAKTVAFGGDYADFTAVDISSYAGGTYYVYKVDTTDEETQEVTSSISITTTASETATEIARIKIADGTLTEVLSSLQYTTTSPLTDVNLHTQISADNILEQAEDELDLVPYTATDLDYTSAESVAVNTDCVFTKDGKFIANSVASVTITKDGIATTRPALEVHIATGVHFKSSVAGKFYYYEGV